MALRELKRFDFTHHKRMVWAKIKPGILSGIKLIALPEIRKFGLALISLFLGVVLVGLSLSGRAPRRGYTGIAAKGYVHRLVNHGEGEYSKGGGQPYQRPGGILGIS